MTRFYANENIDPDFPAQARRTHDVVLPILRLAGQLLRVNRLA
jgi:hypothetical protein